MQKINPFLWFADEAEEALKLYVSLFKNSKISSVSHYDKPAAKAAGMQEGTAFVVTFQLAGQEFVAMNAGPVFKFNPSISFLVNCKTKEEVNELWSKLIVGGSALMELGEYLFSPRYGWLQDKYGLSWQLYLAKEDFQQKIIPTMMFVGKVCGKAEEAIHFYTSIFPHSKAGSITRYGKDAVPDKEGTIAHAIFWLDNQQFAAADSAHEHNFFFNEAISLSVNCKDQKEIDHYWNALSAHPESEQCGWLKDKYGVSWQIVPENINQLIKSPEGMKAMLQMKKLDIAVLEKASK